jgi:hypothetical protein
MKINIEGTRHWGVRYLGNPSYPQLLERPRDCRGRSNNVSSTTEVGRLRSISPNFIFDWQKALIAFQSTPPELSYLRDTA